MGLELVATNRIDRFIFEYSYRVRIRYEGTAADDVEARVMMSYPNEITMKERVVSFNSIAGGSEVVSDDIIRLQQDWRYPLKFSDLHWQIQV